MEPDASARALIAFMKSLNHPALEDCDIERARSLSNVARAQLQPPAPDIAQVEDVIAATLEARIPIRIYRDGAARMPDTAMIFFHGGGFALGDIEGYDIFCRQMARAIGCTILSVEYRRAPEHKFPAAVLDAVAATRWVFEHSEALAIDAKKIILCGDSAGGNLAAVASILLRGDTRERIALQVLLYPVTDHANGYPSKERLAEGYLLSKAAMDYYARLYFSDPAHAADWRASPALAPDLVGLPEALVITAGFDPLVDEGEAYALRMSQFGNTVTLKRYPGQVHGFMTRAKLVPEAASAMGDVAAFVNAKLG